MDTDKDYQVAFTAGAESLERYFSKKINAVENVDGAQKYFGHEPTEKELSEYFWLHRGSEYREALKVLKKVLPQPIH